MSGMSSQSSFGAVDHEYDMMHAPMELEETYIRRLAIFVSVTIIILLFFHI